MDLYTSTLNLGAPCDITRRRPSPHGVISVSHRPHKIGARSGCQTRRNGYRPIVGARRPRQPADRRHFKRPKHAIPHKHTPRNDRVVCAVKYQERCRKPTTRYADACSRELQTRGSQGYVPGSCTSRVSYSLRLLSSKWLAAPVNFTSLLLYYYYLLRPQRFQPTSGNARSTEDNRTTCCLNPPGTSTAHHACRSLNPSMPRDVAEAHRPRTAPDSRITGSSLSSRCYGHG